MEIHIIEDRIRELSVFTRWQKALLPGAPYTWAGIRFRPCSWGLVGIGPAIRRHAGNPASLTIFDFSLSPDGRDVVYAVLRDDDTRNIWVAPLDRSSPARMLQTDADHPGFTPSYIYYTKRALDGAHVHRIHPDGSGDEQIWEEKIQSLATSPDGRYLALTVPIEKSAAGMKHGQQWRLEVVDWARKRVYPVCDDAVAYWSGDGKSFLVSPIRIYKGAPTYVFSPPADGGIPELPSNGISNITEFAKLKHVRTIPQTSIGIGRTPDSYAFVKETVQRNLYRIPLR